MVKNEEKLVKYFYDLETVLKQGTVLPSFKIKKFFDEIIKKQDVPKEIKLLLDKYNIRSFDDLYKFYTKLKKVI